MCIESMRSYAAHLRAAAVVTLLSVTGLSQAGAQTPTNIQSYLSSLPPAIAQALRSNPHFASWLYFYQQRAFPYGRIPAGAYQTARSDYMSKWGTSSASASTFTPNASAIVNQWTSIGPTPISNGQTTPQSVPVSGRVNTIAINPTNTNIIYIGAADGGVWKTTDGGSTWTPLTDNQCSLSMGALAIDPVNTSIIYAGTGEQNFSVDSYYGCGVLRSADGGQTWTPLGASAFGGPAFDSPSISRVLIDPTTAGSTTSTTLLASTDTGVYRSANSGVSWTKVLPGTATDIVRDPSTPATVYAALGNIFGNASNGVYKSTDGGQTWTLLSNGFPAANVGRINLAIAPSSPATLYASVQNTSGLFGSLLGIWKTTNGGASWGQLSATNATCDEPGGGSAQCWYDMYVYVDPTNANTVYFASEDVYKSTNGGNTFTDIGGYSGGDIHPDQHAFAFQPGNPSTIVIGNDGGVFETTNGGSSWSSLNQNLTLTQFYAALSVTPDGSRVLGGSQDNGTNLYSGSSAWSQVLGGDGGSTAIDFNTPTTAYTEFANADPQITTNLGASATWTDISAGLANNKTLFIPPFVMSPSNSHILYLGTDFLNKTINQGSSWSQIGSPGVNGFNPSDGNVSAIVEAKSNSQVIYVGTDGGDVQVTTNGGTNWTDITSGLPSRYITHITVNPTNASNAFVTVSGFGSGHVFETTNGGASWTDISGNLPDIPTNVIFLDPTNPTTTFYIGTDLGVFITANGGTSWSPFQNGLPDVVVEDLVYNGNAGLLFAATHGRGVWTASSQQSSYSLSVSTSGSGTVTSSPTGINCSSNTGTCNFSFASGTGVTLTATAAAGWSFSGWSGACSGTNASCTVNMTQNRSVTATFTQAYALSVSVTGSGMVTSSPAGISCPSACSQSFVNGTSVTLAATPASGSAFSGWGGACGGTGSCVVSMTQPLSVSASFNITKISTTTSLVSSPNPSALGQPVTLTATVTSGNGTPTGTVTFSDGASLNANAPLVSGVATFNTAALSLGSHAITASYSGDTNFAASTSPPLTQTVLSTFTISVSASPAAEGTVCCSGSFAVGSLQTVTATPNKGYLFINWTENGGIVSTSASYSFTLAANRTLVANFVPVAAHDFDGDGKSDVFWLDSANDVGMWLMNGNQILQDKVLGIIASGWSVVGQDDFNGDGKADVLWRDTAGDVAIWLMNGTTVVSSTVLGSVPLNWSIVGTGDFNGDGKADILWLDNQNNVGVWLMNGTQILQAGVVGQLPANSTVVGADMHGDIFLRNMSTGELSMWVMNGTQIARNVDLGPLPLTWSVAGIGDFDGNGSSDILLRNTSGDVQIWLMNGTQVLSTTVLGNVPTNWSIAETGDFNGDGKSDILWVDNLGNVGAWLMNGTAISSTFIYGNVGTAWSVQSLNAD